MRRRQEFVYWYHHDSYNIQHVDFKRGGEHVGKLIESRKLGKFGANESLCWWLDMAKPGVDWKSKRMALPSWKRALRKAYDEWWSRP